MDRIHLADDWDQCWAVGNTVMTFFDFIKFGQLLDKLNDYQILKKKPALWSLLVSYILHQL
jgi:hypothetical protein